MRLPWIWKPLKVLSVVILVIRQAIMKNSCGALSCKITLKAGETRTIAFFLGMKPSSEAAEVIRCYENPAQL